jgi:hypothetical protein
MIHMIQELFGQTLRENELIVKMADLCSDAKAILRALE